MSTLIKEVLPQSDVHLGLPSVSMNEAIEFVGGRLVERKVAEGGYVEGMKKREETVSTYLGNGVAMPHGTFEAKEFIKGTGIVVAQYPEGIDWGTGTAYLVIGLAADGDDHVQVLSTMAEVLQDEDLCSTLWTTTDADLLFNTLSEPEVDDDEDDDDVATNDLAPETDVVITNPSGLHARPATQVVEYAKTTDAKITITKGTKTAKATSIMSVLALGASSGDTVRVAVTAGDADAARVAMNSVIEILTSEEP
ncbi:MAG: HPr family phosphocarrier protein [Acidimicrobiales bacterium]|nr:HPr family phosphocarrier protein [Acidimicrobiales bacterium]